MDESGREVDSLVRFADSNIILQVAQMEHVQQTQLGLTMQANMSDHIWWFLYYLI